jgi:hypothetical protein
MLTPGMDLLSTPEGAMVNIFREIVFEKKVVRTGSLPHANEIDREC